MARSDERQRLVAEAQALLVGQDDVHLVADSQVVLSLILPWVSQRLGWWLNPELGLVLPEHQ